MPLGRWRVEPPGLKRLAPADSADREPAPSEDPVAQNRLPRVFRAARKESTRGGEKRGKETLVAPEKPNRAGGRRAHLLLFTASVNRSKPLLHFLEKIRKSRSQYTASNDEEKLDSCGETVPAHAVCLAHPTASSIALHGSPNVAAQFKPRPPTAATFFPEEQKRLALELLALPK